MSAETAQIVLVGGPLDGHTHPVPAAEAGRLQWQYAAPCTLSVADMWKLGDTIPEIPKRLTYKPMMVDFAGRPVPSITDDGTYRYEYAGEW